MSSGKSFSLGASEELSCQPMAEKIFGFAWIWSSSAHPDIDRNRAIVVVQQVNFMGIIFFVKFCYKIFQQSELRDPGK